MWQLGHTSLGGMSDSWDRNHTHTLRQWELELECMLAHRLATLSQHGEGTRAKKEKQMASTEENGTSVGVEDR